MGIDEKAGKAAMDMGRSMGIPTNQVYCILQAYESARKPERESGYPRIEAILDLFMEANTAFEHEDDVAHMLKFGEAIDMMKYYYHVKANGLGNNPFDDEAKEKPRRGRDD